MDEGAQRFRVQINEPELLCTNRCGFYGTPQWNGLCSQCWRAYQLQQKKSQDYNRNRALLNKNAEEKTSKSASIKAILRKSSSALPMNEQLVSSASSYSFRPLSPDSANVQEDFHSYLYATFSPQVAKDLERQCMNVVDKITQNEGLSMDELSDLVQNFYHSLAEKLSRLKTQPDDFVAADCMAEIERFICTRAYNAVFCTRTDEETADLTLQERIRSLHWVTFGFLETALDFSSCAVQELIDEAVTQIVDLNSHRNVTRKLDCLMKCATKIFEALKESRSGAPASADEFLPVLIYVILKSNPPLIQSNLNFISRFALPSRVLRGESGYHFTNLSCALKFIQDMDANSLRMREEDFDAYTSGRQVAPMRQSTSSSSVNSIKASLKRLEELAESRQRLASRMKEFGERIDNDVAEFKKEIELFNEEFACDELRRIALEANSDQVPD
jgi:hypothetical protein